MLGGEEDGSMSKEREEKLQFKLTQLHNKINWIADKEARAAWVKGVGANGEFFKEKMRLIDETDRVLAELMRINNA
jgi:transcription elongation GreA/GreB family factor